MNIKNSRGAEVTKRSCEFFNGLLHAMREEEDKILSVKGKDYTQGSANRIQNFEKVAEEAGITVQQAWFVYFKKHIDGITSYVKLGKAESEGLKSRIADARNYLALFRQILEVYNPEAL
jgi:hypothetical protein